MIALFVAVLGLGTNLTTAGEGVDEARIRYLGASGLSIRLGDEHLLTAPFFSNPGLARVIFGRISPEPERFPADIEALVSDARGILVGHSHYDHLMDVPAIAPHLPRTAAIYANRTARHILAAVEALPVRVVAVDRHAGDHAHPGAWITLDGGGIRFMPIASGHAPHLGGVRLYDGEYTQDLKRLPRRAQGWKLGQPHSFVIDFLDSDGARPRFRIYYQDAATDPPEGFPPPLDDGKPFDLAVLCVASFGQVERHPEAILEALQPQAVLLTHWEDFFEPQSKPVEPVPATDVDRFLERLEAALPEETPRWMPEPGETIAIPLRR